MRRICGVRRNRKAGRPRYNLNKVDLQFCTKSDVTAIVVLLSTVTAKPQCRLCLKKQHEHHSVRPSLKAIRIDDQNQNFGVILTEKKLIAILWGQSES